MQWNTILSSKFLFLVLTLGQISRIRLQPPGLGVVSSLSIFANLCFRNLKLGMQGRRTWNASFMAQKKVIRVSFWWDLIQPRTVGATTRFKSRERSLHNSFKGHLSSHLIYCSCWLCCWLQWSDICSHYSFYTFTHPHMLVKDSVIMSSKERTLFIMSKKKDGREQKDEK